MLYLLILLQLGDIITTAIALRNGATEANPFAKALFDRLPPIPTMVGLKLLFSVPMVALCVRYPNWWPVPALYCVSLVYVLWNNASVIRAQYARSRA